MKLYWFLFLITILVFCECLYEHAMAHVLVSPSAGGTYDQPQVVRFGTKYLSQLSHELLSCWLLALHVLTKCILLFDHSRERQLDLAMIFWRAEMCVSTS